MADKKKDEYLMETLFDDFTNSNKKIGNKKKIVLFVIVIFLVLIIYIFFIQKNPQKYG